MYAQQMCYYRHLFRGQLTCVSIIISKLLVVNILLFSSEKKNIVNSPGFMKFSCYFVLTVVIYDYFNQSINFNRHAVNNDL